MVGCGAMLDVGCLGWAGISDMSLNCRFPNNVIFIKDKTPTRSAGVSSFMKCGLN